jgi:type II secretory pathway pseudopilin PulG
MVLIVIGLVILIVYPALNAVRQGAQRSATDASLQALMRAAAVYTQANGCLPCPTPAATTGSGFGRVRGDTNAAPCSGCPQPEGIPPFVSMGIPESMARDGWGRWITMRVDPALTVNFGVVPPTALCTDADVASSLCPVAGVSQKGLCRSGLSAANRINVQTPGGPVATAAVIFVSHGANGRGAFVAGALAGGLNGERLPFPGGPPSCVVGNEPCNASGTLNFVNATQVVDKNNPYDDSMLFADRNNIVSWLGNGSCQTTW